MASVDVFVDDAVQGNLPFVCAKTGRPADGVQRIEQKIGAPSGWLALFVLLPGIGWLILVAVLILSIGRPTLTVRIPISQEALAVQRYWRRWWIGGAAATVLFVFEAFRPTFHQQASVSLVLAAAAFAISMAAYAGLLASFVRVRLDASRRWVTLRGIDPSFRDAVRERGRGEHEHHRV